MKEQKLTWPARGRLWFRIGVRLVLLIVGLDVYKRQRL